MILKKLNIISFGGLSGEEINFEPGLNIILGPNEAGKSTMFHAIQHILLTPAKMTAPVFRKTIQQFLPVGGGDTVTCELSFEYNSSSYVLRKSWGNTIDSELVLPDGSRISKEDSIRSHLRDILPAEAGTIKSVFMTHQSGLARTISDLQNQDDTLRSFSDILRKAVLETDGVSVSRFSDRIQEQYKDYFARWDIKRDHPEQGRGIDNPYKSGIGRVLKAYYKQAELKRKFEDIQKQEDALGGLNKKIEEYNESLKEKEEYIKGNKKASEDAKERGNLEDRMESLQLKAKNLKSGYDRWPVLEKTIKDNAKAIPEQEKRLEELNKEKEQADLVEKNRRLKEKYDRVKGKKEILDEKRKLLEKTRKFLQEDMDDLKRVLEHIERLKAGLSAGKINLRFDAKKEITFSVTKGLEPAVTQEISQGNCMEFNAQGKILLSHKDWDIEVTSGEGNYDVIEKRFRDEAMHFKELLGSHDVGSVEEAERLCQEYNKALGAFNTATQNLEDELGEESLDELEQKVKETGIETGVRPIGNIVRDITLTEQKIESLNEEKQKAQDKLEALTGDYGNKDKLFEEIVSLKTDEKQLGNQIENLSPLPEGFTDAKTFIDKYETTKEKVNDVKEEIHNLKLERTRVEENMPDESSEEVGRAAKEAEEVFEKELKKGKAVEKVLYVTQSLMAELDNETFTGFEKLVSGYAEQLTGGRYKQVHIEKTLPEGLIRADGRILPYLLLSIGTKDVFSLALRLSMAEYFLGGQKGFLIMDDPLVDLDPERQKIAAGVLSVFAGRAQLIIFTCHPSHMEWFNNPNIIEINTG